MELRTGETISPGAQANEVGITSPAMTALRAELAATVAQAVADALRPVNESIQTLKDTVRECQEQIDTVRTNQERLDTKFAASKAKTISRLRVLAQAANRHQADGSCYPYGPVPFDDGTWPEEVHLLDGRPLQLLTCNRHVWELSGEELETYLRGYGHTDISLTLNPLWHSRLLVGLAIGANPTLLPSEEHMYWAGGRS